MTVEQVIQHFGGVSQTARALGISYQAVAQWTSVPEGRQWQIQALTNGQLKACTKAA